jgi:UDP:flavonoid glycosyltransferase YjiC (YdhE family)
MSTIVIAMFPELGHLNATLKLARSLRLRGHQVYYLVGSDYEAYMRAQGLNFISLGESLRKGPKSLTQLDIMEYLLDARMRGRALNEYFTGVVQMFRQEIVSLIPKLKPNLFLIDLFVPDIALVAQELGLPFVFLNTSLVSQLADTSVLSSHPELAQVPELVLCPAEFDFPQSRQPGQSVRYYLGASVDLHRKEDDPFDWQKLNPAKRLIVCSLGSLSQTLDGAKNLFQVIIDAVSDLADCQLILVTGAHFVRDFPRVPANVMVMSRVPLLQMIEKADVLITHGGFNTVKEALLLGTPVIVFPFSNDQPMNAARIVYHGLGLTGNATTVTAEQARALIERVLQPGFRERVLAFRQLLQKTEAEDLGSKIVEAILANVEKRARAASGATVSQL